MDEALLARYQAGQVASDNPDYLGRELYRAVYRDLLQMRVALREQRWDRLTNKGSHAQWIITGLHDNALAGTREGEMFRITHRHLWQLLNQVMAEHREEALASLEAFISDFIHQLDARLEQSRERATAVVAGGRTEWTG